MTIETAAHHPSGTLTLADYPRIAFALEAWAASWDAHDEDEAADVRALAGRIAAHRRHSIRNTLPRMPIEDGGTLIAALWDYAAQCTNVDEAAQYRRIASTAQIRPPATRLEALDAVVFLVCICALLMVVL